MLDLTPAARIAAGVAAGVVVGAVAALMGVAGGELLIPTIVLLYGIDVLRASTRFLVATSTELVTGTILGGLLLGVVPAAVLIPLLVALLLASAIKVWRHQ